MKKYNKFITESIQDNFIFAINIKYISFNELDKLFKEIEINFPDYEDYGNYVNRASLEEDLKKDFNKPWALTFNIYQDFRKVAIGKVTTPNWGYGIEYMDNILSIEEFLNVGFTGVRQYVTARKYNL